jgi:hypothetical protein
MILDIYFKNGTILKNIEIGIKIPPSNNLKIIKDEYVIKSLLVNSFSNNIETENEIDYISDTCRGTFKKSQMIKYEFTPNQKNPSNNFNNMNLYYNKTITEESSLNSFDIKIPDNNHFITYKDTVTKLPPIAYFFHGYRLKHSLGVCNLMKKIINFNEVLFTEEEKTLLELSALYHEIGYSDEVKYLDYYPLDGSIYIYHTTHNKMLTTMLKYHSFAEKLVPPNLKIHYEYNTLSLNVMLSEMVDLLTLCDIFVEENGMVKKDSIMERYHNRINMYGEDNPQTLIFKDNMPAMYKIYDKYKISQVLKNYVNENLY